MATLYVRNLPRELHSDVKANATQHRHKISGEVAEILEQIIEEDERRQQGMEALKRISERRERWTPPPDAVDSLTLLREDRAR